LWSVALPNAVRIDGMNSRQRGLADKPDGRECSIAISGRKNPTLMDQLRAMKVFTKVIDEGGFAKAARALDLAPPVVTRIVAELEDHLGARLLNRTTRSIALTDVGEQYLDKVRAILVEIEESEALASEATKVPRGHLRLLCPPAIAVHQLAKHLPRFQTEYPQVTLEVSTPGPVTSVDENFDVTLFTSRDAPDGDYIAQRLARTEVVICATPAYLDRMGRPGHPSELRQHQAVLPPPSVAQGLKLYRGYGAATEGWELEMSAHPALSTASIDLTYAAVQAGLGIGGLPSYVIADALFDNVLEHVLPEWRLFDVTLWAGRPTRRHLPARTRVFLDFLMQIFGGEDRDPWLTAAGCALRGA
jgi:DNA-binding transcriptional LysR family regulator